MKAEVSPEVKACLAELPVTDRLRSALEVVYARRVVKLGVGEQFGVKCLSRLSLDVGFDLTKKKDRARFVGRCVYWFAKAGLLTEDGRRPP